MEIKKGDYVSRNSYKNDTIFKVVNIKGNMCYLKGVDVRLYADSELEDLVLTELIKEEEQNSEDTCLSDENMLRNEYFYLPAKVLHIDGDSFLSNYIKSL